MHVQFGCLIVLAIATHLLLPGVSRAHRLLAEYKVLPGNRIQIESWFDFTGDSASDAKVSVYGAGGELFTEGRCNSEGVFVFAYRDVVPMRVVVAAGAGHTRELSIGKEELHLAHEGNLGTKPFADRHSGTAAKDIVLGLSFIFALAALFMSIRNARRLAELKRK